MSPGISTRPPPAITRASPASEIGSVAIRSIPPPRTSTFEGAERAGLVPSKIRTSVKTVAPPLTGGAEGGSPGISMSKSCAKPGKALPESSAASKNGVEWSKRRRHKSGWIEWFSRDMQAPRVGFLMIPIVCSSGVVPKRDVAAEALGWRGGSQENPPMPPCCRYERGAMLTTSNRAVGEWGAAFGDAVVATAILDGCDRLIRHCHVIAIGGNSYRLREERGSGLLQKSAAAPETETASS